MTSDMKVLFLVEWDGALCKACADQLRHQTVLYQPALHPVVKPLATRRFTYGEYYQYVQHYEHAEGYRLSELLKDCAEELCVREDVHVELQTNSRACINAAVMWHYGTPPPA